MKLFLHLHFFCHFWQHLIIMDPFELSYLSAQLRRLTQASKWDEAHCVAMELANTSAYTRKHPEIHNTLIEIEHRMSGAPWRTLIDFAEDAGPPRPQSGQPRTAQPKLSPER